MYQHQLTEQEQKEKAALLAQLATELKEFRDELELAEGEFKVKKKSLEQKIDLLADQVTEVARCYRDGFEWRDGQADLFDVKAAEARSKAMGRRKGQKRLPPPPTIG